MRVLSFWRWFGAALVFAAFFAGPAFAEEAAPGDPSDLRANKDAAMMSTYFRGYMMARFCLNHQVEFSEAEVDRVQDELNKVADASTLTEDQKSQIWYALQSNLNSMGGEVTQDDCAETRKALLKLMPQAFAAKPQN